MLLFLERPAVAPPGVRDLDGPLLQLGDALVQLRALRMGHQRSLMQQLAHHALGVAHAVFVQQVRAPLLPRVVKAPDELGVVQE
jgi:hypothetical protein